MSEEIKVGSYVKVRKERHSIYEGYEGVVISIEEPVTDIYAMHFVKYPDWVIEDIHKKLGKKVGERVFGFYRTSLEISRTGMELV